MLRDGAWRENAASFPGQSIATMRRLFTPEVDPSGWLAGGGYGLTFEIVSKPQHRDEDGGNAGK